jgi:hypothetical protein
LRDLVSGLLYPNGNFLSPGLNQSSDLIISNFQINQALSTEANKPDDTKALEIDDEAAPFFFQPEQLVMSDHQVADKPAKRGGGLVSNKKFQAFILGQDRVTVKNPK